MWQRLQTLYLCIATGLVAALFFSVKAFTLGEGGTHAAELTYSQNVVYLVLLIVITLLQLLAIFTYDKRVFQMRTAVLSAILMVALQVLLAMDYFTAADGQVFKFTAVFPLVAAILNALAARFILRDQLLVESVTHLRSHKKNHKK
jgi:presenilin-like A22 family membrane protease